LFKFLNIYLTDSNSRTYTFYIINCKRFYKLWDIHILKFHLICSSFVLFGSFIDLIFIQMDQIASNVLTIPIEKSMIFYYFFLFT
jgi:hypothetical protein